MTKSEHPGWRRRDFLSLSPMVLAGGFAARAATADDRPPVTNPRATVGDVVEPKWESGLTITVGPQKADLVGADDKVIQAGVHLIAGRGGGTVHILPGTYRLRNAVSLRSGVRILGSGPDSVLVKEPEIKTKLTATSETWDQEVTVADPSGFRVGDGVCLEVRVPRIGHYTIRRTVIARSGNRFKLDRNLNDHSFGPKADGTMMTLFPLFSGDGIADATIENLALDGNRANQETLDHYWGNYIGGVWLNLSNRIQIRNITSRGSCADGISWQTSHDVLVEDCRCLDNVGFGLHAGSGSQRLLARGNRLERNYIGFYFCWGAKYGLAENNVILDSLTAGVSLGEKDTDNLIRGNEIRQSGEVGVLFRAVGEGREYFPDRNRLEGNRILDNGPESGVAVDVRGEPDGTVVSHNDIQETRQPMKRIGIRIGARAGGVKLAENRIRGFAVDISDLRRPAEKQG